MKKIFFAALLTTLVQTSFAQAKRPPLFFQPDLGINNTWGWKPYGSFAIGITNKKGQGGGIGVGYYDNGRPYYPIYVTVHSAGPDYKLSPFFQMDFGFGIFKESTANRIVEGGPYLKGKAGLAFPLGKSRTKGYVFGGLTGMTFTTTTKYSNSTTEFTSLTGMLCFGFGWKFVSGRTR
jgi:hypothetical protein